jgi:PAS domain S-box-containing protein
MASRPLDHGADLLRIAVAHQRDAVLITEADRVDPAGRRILFVNPAFTLLTGWSADEAIGRTPDLTVGPLTDRSTMQRIVAAIDAHQPIREEILKYRKDGSTLWVEIDLAPVWDEEHRCRYFVSVMRDITEKKMQSERLAAQAMELERVAQQRSQFLANLAHELRTPLNAIVGNASILAEGIFGPLNEQTAKAVGRIAGNGRTLVALINELLDVARMSAGKMPVTRERFDVTAVVAEVVAELQPMAPDLAVSSRGPVPLFASTDRQKVKQIVSNLVSNAIKFTAQGSVHVEVSEHGDQIATRVIDTGVGIANENHERVFEDFWQVGGAVSRSHGGAGLGLPIARRLATLLGGDLTFVSAVGSGSTFTLRFPRELVLAPAGDHPGAS